MRLLAVCALCLAILAPPVHAAVVPGEPIDGPSPDVGTAVDVDLAADGTGAVAWLRKDGGQDHVFVALIANGAFGAPMRVDTGLAQPSRRPAVAASSGGRVVVGFLNGPGPNYKLHAALKPAGGAFAAPEGIVLDPAIKSIDVDMNENGIAYAVYGAVGGQTDVRAARLDGSTWTQVGADFPGAGGVLDADPGVDAGPPDGQRESRVAVTGAGNAVVAWTEEGAVVGNYSTYARRLTGAAVGGPPVPADVPSLEGYAASGASDMADLDVDESGAAWVVFRQLFTYGATDRPRDLARRLTGDAFGGAQILDGMPTPPPEGAEFPRIDLAPGGRGLVAMPRQVSFETWGSSLTGGDWTAGFRVDSLTNAAPSAPVAALGEAGGLIAWLLRPGATDPTSVRGRYYADAAGAEVALSQPALGTADGGPEAAADAAGNVAVAFTQFDGANRTVVGAFVDAPAGPGGGGPGDGPGDGPDDGTGDGPGDGTGDGPDDGGAPGGDEFGSKTRVRLVGPKRLRPDRRARIVLRVRNRNAFRVTGRGAVVTAKRSAAAARKRRTLAKRKLALPARRTKTVRFKLTRRGKRLLAREGRVRVKATLRLRDPAGERRTVARAFRLRR